KLGNRRAGRLGVAGGDAADSRASRVYRAADRERLQPDAGAQLGYLWTRGHSRAGAELGGGGGALVSGVGRNWIGRSESAGVDYVLAVFASAVGGAAGVRAYV